MAANFAFDEMIRDLIAQPVARATDDFDVLRLQTDLFFQLAKHGLLRGLAVLDAPLRELPRMFLDALSPPHFVLAIDQNNADVGPKAFSIEHVVPQNFLRLGDPPA